MQGRGREAMAAWWAILLLNVAWCAPASSSAGLPCSPGAVSRSNGSDGFSVIGGAGTSSGGASSGGLTGVTCTWTIGTPNSTTTLRALIADSTSLLARFELYDAPTADPVKLRLRLSGNGVALGLQGPLPDAIVSRTGFFTLQLTWETGLAVGAGVQAAFSTITSGLPPQRQQLAIPGGGAATVSTVEELVDALESGVAELTLVADIALAGESLWVASQAAITGSCGARACILDGLHSSCIFEVGPGARLTIRGLHLRNGRALTGAAVLVSANATFRANDCTFADSRSTGDGGGVAALAGSFVELGNNSVSLLDPNPQSSVFQVMSAARSGDGGGVFVLAAPADPGEVKLMPLAVSACLFNGNTAAANGGALAAYGNIRLTLADSVVQNSMAASGGATSLGFGAHALVARSVFRDNAAGTGPALEGPSVCPVQLGIVLQGGSGGSGGAFWLNEGSNVTMVETELSGNAARGGSGGALALQTGASVSAHNSLLSSNCAALGGGAISLQGTASLSLSSSSITSNAAFFGAFIGYEDPTAALSGVALSELTILNNAAVAGALYGMISGSQALQINECRGCSTENNTASSYGPIAATAPSQFAASVTPVVRPGRIITISLVMSDSLNQTVIEYPTVVVSVRCVSQQSVAYVRPAVGAQPEAVLRAVQGCDTGTLTGTLDAIYRNGSAVLSPFLYGLPNTNYTLAVSVRGIQGVPVLGPGLVQLVTSTTACGQLETFDTRTRLCSCVPYAGRGPLGLCTCSDGWSPSAVMVNGTETDESVCVPSKPRLSQQDIRIIIGCTIGGALLLVAAASFLVARFSRRRAEERYRLPLSQAEKRAADMQQEVLQQSELNAVISHEVRTPTNALAGALLLLGSTKLSKDQAELLEVMQAGVTNMTQLIGDILVLSRFKAGKFTLSPVPTQLRRGCLETTWKMIVLHQQQRGAAGKLNLVLKVDDSLPWVANVDAVRIQQILLNALTNSCKFTPDGGTVTLGALFSATLPAGALRAAARQSRPSGAAVDATRGGSGPSVPERKASQPQQQGPLAPAGASSSAAGSSREIRPASFASAPSGGLEPSTGSGHALFAPPPQSGNAPDASVTTFSTAGTVGSSASRNASRTSAGRRLDPTDSEEGGGSREVLAHQPGSRLSELARSKGESAVVAWRRRMMRRGGSRAAKADGGVQNTIPPNSHAQDGYLVFSVTDTGVGLGAEDLDRIFDAFAMGKEGGKAGYGGTGLGLNISKRLAEEMGGGIFAESGGPGKGTCVTFYMPFMPPEDASMDAADPTVVPEQFSSRQKMMYGSADGSSSRPSTPGDVSGTDAVSLSISSASGVRIQPASVATSRSITDVAPPGTDESARRATAAAGQEAAASAGCLLVAEDDKLSQLVVKKTLVQAGFEVVLVENGQLAVDAWLADPTRFSVIILDHNMNVMNGPTAARIITKLAAERKLYLPPIVAFCGAVSEEEVEEFRQAGCVGHIAKPISNRVIDQIREIAFASRNTLALWQLDQPS